MLATWGCTTFSKPTIDLQFAGATSLDNRITFTRGSQATLFDSTGTLVYAKQNVLLQSQDFSTTWSVASQNASITTNTAVAPDGTTTADTITDDATSGIHRVSQSVTTSSTTQLVFSVFAKYSTMQWIGLSAATATNAWAGAKFDIKNGVLGSTSQQGTGWAANSSSITPVGNGWYRCVLVFTPGATGATTFLVNCATDGTTFTASQRGSELYSGTGSSAFIWGAQLNTTPIEGGVTASLDTYYPTTTAAYYAPRFDYNPSTLAPQGLLIEEQRTNSIRNNTMVGAVAGTPGTLPTNWLIQGSGVGTLTQEIVGTGIQNGINYIDIKYSGTTSTTDLRIAFESNTQITAATGQSWTASVYTAVVAGSLSNISAIENTIVERNAAGAFLGESTQTINTTNALVRSSISRTFNEATAARVNSQVKISLSSGVAINITLRIGLPQLELGAFATSVIPTTTTALTRNADVASMTGTNFSSWYNALQGTFVVTWDIYQFVAGVSLRFAVSDGTSSNQYRVRLRDTGTTQVRHDVTNAGVTTALGSPGVLATVNNEAFAYATNNYGGVLNGGAVATAVSLTLPTVNQINLGGGVAGVNPLNGHLRSLTYYPTRLANSTLQALTA